MFWVPLSFFSVSVITALVGFFCHVPQLSPPPSLIFERLDFVVCRRSLENQLLKVALRTKQRLGPFIMEMNHFTLGFCDLLSSPVFTLAVWIKGAFASASAMAANSHKPCRVFFS